jgi:hypothetical protein
MAQEVTIDEPQAEGMLILQFSFSAFVCHLLMQYIRAMTFKKSRRSARVRCFVECHITLTLVW